jgi:predicted porin
LFSFNFVLLKNNRRGMCRFFCKKVLQSLFHWTSIPTERNIFNQPNWEFFMNKKIVAIAIAAVLAAPMALQAAPTVYGQMDFSLENDNDLEDGGWSMGRNDTNLGVKGSEDLGNGLSAVYQIEYGIDGATSGALGGGSLYQRNTYVGLAGGFGTFLMGRHDTPYKIATNSLDPFNNSTADQGNNGMLADRRLGSVLAYISPSMGGFTLAGAISLVETGGVDNDADDLGNIYSVAGMYSNGPFYGSLAVEGISDDATGSEDETRAKLGLGYTINTIKLALIGAQATAIGGVDDSDSTTIKAYATFGFGNTALKLGYGQQAIEHATADDLDQTVITAGVDHSLSKSTKVYAIYDSYDDDSSADADYDTIALGMEVSF